MPKHKFQPLANGDRGCANCPKVLRQNAWGAWITIQGAHSSKCGSPAPPGVYIDGDCDVIMGEVVQPPYSRGCGQVAIANIVGCTFKEACDAVGHRGGTSAREVVAGLKELGWSVPRGVWGKARPSYGMAKVITSPHKKNWHWMAVVEGQLVNGFPYVGIYGSRVVKYLYTEKEE